MENSDSRNGIGISLLSAKLVISFVFAVPEKLDPPVVDIRVFVGIFTQVTSFLNARRGERV